MTTDVIFNVRQLQGRFLDKSKNLLFAFTAFDRVPRKVLWWAMRVVGVPESIVVILQSMYNDAKSKVRVNG